MTPPVKPHGGQDALEGAEREEVPPNEHEARKTPRSDLWVSIRKVLNTGKTPGNTRISWDNRSGPKKCWKHFSGPDPSSGTSREGLS